MEADSTRKVFVTGGTGYLGSRLVPTLVQRGHAVTAVVRGAGPRVPGVHLVPGDALDPALLRAHLGDCDTWVQLIGTPKPSPWKAEQFRAVDLRAVVASLEALPGSQIRHYVYLSVAQPAPVMQAYVAVRAEAEAKIRAARAAASAGGATATLQPPGHLAATFLRPWYVLGPGHRWPAALLPAYALLARWPATRAGAERLGLVTLREMLAALVWAVEHPPADFSVLGVPEIRDRAHASSGRRPR